MKHARNRNPAAAVLAVLAAAAVAAAVTVAAVAAKMTIAAIAEVPAAGTRAAAARKDSRTRIIAKSRVSRASLAGNNRIPPKPRDAKSSIISSPSGDRNDDNIQEAAKGNEAPRQSARQGGTSPGEKSGWSSRRRLRRRHRLGRGRRHPRRPARSGISGYSGRRHRARNTTIAYPTTPSPRALTLPSQHTDVSRSVPAPLQTKRCSLNRAPRRAGFRVNVRAQESLWVVALARTSMAQNR